MQKIAPFFWFYGNAEEAVEFYTSVFERSRVVGITRYGAEGPWPEGTLFMATFELDGQRFYALNGNPKIEFSQALSLVADCATQEEVDRYWEKLAAGGGTPGPCGWIADRFGVSWQIIPSVLPKLMSDPDPARSKRVMDAMVGMGKLDIAALVAAAEGA